MATSHDASALLGTSAIVYYEGGGRVGIYVVRIDIAAILLQKTGWTLNPAASDTIILPSTPIGFLALGARLYVETASTDTGSATATIADGTTTYISAANLKATGATVMASASVPAILTSAGTVTLTLGGACTSLTTGVFDFEIPCMVLDRLPVYSSTWI